MSFQLLSNGQLRQDVYGHDFQLSLFLFHIAQGQWCGFHDVQVNLYFGSSRCEQLQIGRQLPGCHLQTNMNINFAHDYCIFSVLTTRIDRRPANSDRNSVQGREVHYCIMLQFLGVECITLKATSSQELGSKQFHQNITDLIQYFKMSAFDRHGQQIVLKEAVAHLTYTTDRLFCAMFSFKLGQR